MKKYVNEMLKNYFTDNKEVLLDVVRELNSWNGSFEEYDYRENDEEFFNTFFEGKPQEAVRASYYGEYNFCDAYVRLDVYGNLKSTDYPEEDVFEIVDDIINTMLDEIDNIEVSEDIQNIIDECDEEDEEE